MEKEDSLTSATAAQMMTREPLTLPEDTMIIEAEEKNAKAPRLNVIGDQQGK